MAQSEKILASVKQLKGITDDQQDSLINTLIDLTEQSLLAYLPSETTEVPSNLEFIIIEVTVKRFNRLGAEGVKKKTLEGLTLEFSDTDFNEYLHLFEDGGQPSGGEGVVLFF